MSILRKLKLHNLVGHMESTEPFIAMTISLFDELFRDISIVTYVGDMKETNTIYHKNGVLLFTHDDRSDTLWCRSEIWQLFEFHMNLSYTEVHYIFKLMLKDRIPGAYSPHTYAPINYNYIEKNKLKSKGDHWLLLDTKLPFLVESEYKYASIALGCSYTTLNTTRIA